MKKAQTRLNKDVYSLSDAHAAGGGEKFFIDSPPDRY
jgi:hypothetical protein